jgi:DNA replication initiation complex subunit (GINS family)
MRSQVSSNLSEEEKNLLEAVSERIEKFLAYTKEQIKGYQKR